MKPFSVLLWREWQGVRWHDWRKSHDGLGAFMRYSLYLGWIEIRWWVKKP